jgi:hypothetical protein
MGASSDPTPLRPGNSGGGKDADFWCAFEDGEEGVIGDEPRNARKDDGLQGGFRTEQKSGPEARACVNRENGLNAIAIDVSRAQ